MLPVRPVRVDGAWCGLCLRPMTTSERFQHALSLHDAGDLSAAASEYRRILETDPGHVGALTNLAAVLVALGGGRHADALSHATTLYREALEIDPGRWEIWNNLGNACRESGDLDNAIASLWRATELKPDSADAWMNLGTALKDIADLDSSLAAYSRAVELRPRDAPTLSNLLFAAMFHPDCDPVKYRQACEGWDLVHAAPLRQASPRSYRNDRDPQRRLRVGYIGADFRQHAQSHFTLPLLRCHDPARIKPFIYSSTFPEDAVTTRLRDAVAGAGGMWRDVTRVSDGDVAEHIRRDGIDILIDLTMHMAGSRLGVLARKPAPIQLTYLAYPGTTGLRDINFRLTDPLLDPPAHFSRYTEASLPLETFWCYDPLTADPQPGPPPFVAAGHVTFGSLNNFCKVSPRFLGLVESILTDLPTARLVLLSSHGSHRQVMLNTLPRHVADRIEFTPYLPRQDYLRLHQRIDIALDPVPVNGHTTSLDALWMGVPVVTLVGPTAMGRAGLSQLTNLGLPELIAHTDTDYIRVATSLASDPARLTHLRETLRTRLESSVLMNAPRFTAYLEATLRTLWQQWCAA